MKEIVIISKNESKILNKEYGVRFGENGISTTKSHGKTSKYYLTESEDNMKYLKKIRG